MRNLLAVIMLSAPLTGCYWSAVAGTPSGIREHHIGQNGSIAVIRDREDDPYHATQRHREEQKTLRIQLGGGHGRDK